MLWLFNWYSRNIFHNDFKEKDKKKSFLTRKQFPANQSICITVTKLFLFMQKSIAFYSYNSFCFTFYWYESYRTICKTSDTFSTICIILRLYFIALNPRNDTVLHCKLFPQEITFWYVFPFLLHISVFF